MPALNELRNTCSPSGILLEALQRFERKTGRNVVLCHSGFLKVQSAHVTIMHEDMEAYMNAFNGLDKRKGLDVILHTPGGYVDAAEGIGNYWRSVFFGNVEAYIPHLAFSCGTLLAFACKTIHMTKASGLGPVDPAFGGRRVESIIADFEHAFRDVAANPNLALIWNPILEKHGPCAYEEALRAREHSAEIARTWLKTGMLRNAPEKNVEAIVSIFNSHKATKSHGRQFPYEVWKNLRLNVSLVEADPELQDLLMTIHHAATLYVEMTGNAKIIINANGKGKVFAP